MQRNVRQKVGRTVDIAEPIEREWKAAGYSELVARALEQEGINKGYFLNAAKDLASRSPLSKKKYQAALGVALYIGLGRVVDAIIQHEGGDPYQYQFHYGRAHIAAVCGHPEALHTALNSYNRGVQYGLGLAAARAGRFSVVQRLVRRHGLVPLDRKETIQGLRGFLLGEAAKGDHLRLFVWLIRRFRLNFRQIKEGRVFAYVWGDCLKWCLRQPNCALGELHSFELITMSINIHEWGAGTRHPIGGKLDFRNRELGDSGCAQIAIALSMDCGTACAELDFSENPRITEAGVLSLLDHLGDTPTCGLGRFRLVSDLTESPLPSYKVDPTCDEFTKRLLLPDLPPRGVNRVRQMVWHKNRCSGARAMMDVVCPFPSLVTMVSFWIADRIRYSGKPDSKEKPQ